MDDDGQRPVHPSRHRPCLLALGLSATFHGMLMGADKLITTRAGTVHGNLEHLYGDVAS